MGALPPPPHFIDALGSGTRQVGLPEKPLSLLHELERHQRRREQGIPTMTVLAGPAGSALALWRRWLDSRQRSLCTVLAANEAEAVQAWMETLSRVRDLEADAADFLGTAARLAPGELRGRLKGQTFHERDVLLQELLLAAPSGDATTACRCLLQTGAAPGRPSNPLHQVLEACGRDWTRTLAALHALVPAGSAPALLLASHSPQALVHAAATGARLCGAVPALLVALMADRPAVDAYLRSSESRAVALVREGMLELETPSPEALKRKLQTLGVRGTAALSDSLARLATDGASDELITQFGEVAREHEAAATDSEAGDRARSAAERFMRMLLDAIPDTQGLFQLNQRASFRINNRPVEVDFLCERLRVAIEIDGYYHFQDPKAYRRDRRKDLALQLHGYLVLRFLASDVVERLEDIRNTLLQAIAHQRQLSGAPTRYGEDSDGGA